MYHTEFEISDKDLGKWFNRKQFSKADFSEGPVFVNSYKGAHMVTVKLSPNPGFVTYYKEAMGGSVLVFEVSIQEGRLVYDCYSPIWLFGIWTKKLKFKEKTGPLTKYLEKGFQLHKEFIEYLSDQ